MQRRLSNIAAVTLLAASVVLTILWIRSHWRSDTVYRQATPQAWSLASNDGGLTLGRRIYDGLWLQETTWGYYAGNITRIGFGVQVWRFAGFARGELQSTFGIGELAYKFQDEYWTVPYWVLLLAVSVYPAFWILSCSRAYVARARIRRGQCPLCGYDLRASQGRCPECGRSAPPAAA